MSSNQAFAIRSADKCPCYLSQLLARFELEWGEIDSFEGNHKEVTVPPPLMLLDDQDRLVGGLAFSSFLRPGVNKIGVWINALLIEPEYRNQGFASRLVKAAEMEAAKIGLTKLFVQTEFPVLYRKLGWRKLEQSGFDFVLAKALLEQSSM